jgi:hypothetical protein
MQPNFGKANGRDDQIGDESFPDFDICIDYCRRPSGRLIILKTRGEKTCKA